MKQTRDMKTLQLILLALITVPVCGAQTYAIRFSTSPPVGQIFGVTASGSMHQDISRGANVLNTMEYHVDFQGSAEVLEIDSIKTSFTVERFTMTTDGTTVELLKPGNVIIADGRAQQPVSLKGGTMDENVREAFRMVHSVHKEGDATDDEIFGTKDRKSIVDNWSINIARAFDSLKNTGLTVPRGHLSGTVTLVAKDKIAGIDCLSLRGEVAADGISSTGLLHNVTLDRSKVEAIFHGCYPIEDSGLSFKEGTELTMQAQVTTKDGTALDFTLTQKADSIWTARRN